MSKHFVSSNSIMVMPTILLSTSGNMIFNLMIIMHQVICIIHIMLINKSMSIIIFRNITISIISSNYIIKIILTEVMRNIMIKKFFFFCQVWPRL